MATNNRLADGVAQVAEAIRATPAQVALAWVRSRDVAAIPGDPPNRAPGRELGITGITLSKEHLSRLEALINQGVAGARY